MSAQRFFEDDDLALYALGLLSAPEASAVTDASAHDGQLRQRITEIRAQLGAFAEATSPQTAAPEGSLDRLMGQISRESKGPLRPQLATPVADRTPVATPVSEPTPARSFTPWLGWAVAAGLAFTAGTLYLGHSREGSEFSQQSAQVAQLSNEAAALRQQTAAAQAALTAQQGTVAALASQRAAAERQATVEHDQAAQLRSAEARRAADLAQTATQLSSLNAQLASATTDQQRLQQTVSAQAAQLNTQSQQLTAANTAREHLAAEAAQARELTEALTDRSALRVTLTQPKSKPEPTVRTTYIASRGALVFQGSHLATLADNKVYELWVLPADGSAPIPAGTFAPDAQGNANLTYLKLARGGIAPKAFAVTIENQGGSQTPTMPIVLVGTAS